MFKVLALALKWQAKLSAVSAHIGKHKGADIDLYPNIQKSKAELKTEIESILGTHDP